VIPNLRHKNRNRQWEMIILFSWKASELEAQELLENVDEI
jgi:hypothetical protein